MEITPSYSRSKVEKNRGYWIAIQVFMVSRSCVVVCFSVWYNYEGFVYTARKQGAITPQEELILFCYYYCFLEVNFIDL